MKYFIWLLRIVLGCLFIFSGMVKANDPLGLTYKMNEIFELWGMSSMVNYSELFSVLIIAFEVVAGVAMLVGNAFALWITLMVLLNFFFTFLTWFAWSSGKVKECGCFGDCFKISNSATFYKDVALTAIAVFLWIYRYRVFPLFQKTAVNAGIVAAATLFIFGFQWWTLHHLPTHDCLPYRTGNSIWQKMQPSDSSEPAVYSTILTYEKNGVKKDFTSEEFNSQKIWEDSKWKFVDSKSTLVKEATGQPEIPHDFTLTGFDGEDHTEEVLTDSGYTFLWFVREANSESVKKNIEKNMDKLHNIIDRSATMHVKFYVLCSSGKELCKTYQEVWNMKDVTFFMLDQTVSK
ncbi:MAG: DoxX family protein, partial [Taibaiella sp.]|nr:DoxX family protein [Taibaiella sp.]